MKTKRPEQDRQKSPTSVYTRERLILVLITITLFITYFNEITQNLHV